MNLRYGGGRTLGMAWPVELGQVEMSAFVTGHIGRHRWGSVLKRYFINSKGVALYIDPNTPLYVSINADEEASLCLQVRRLMSNNFLLVVRFIKESDANTRLLKYFKY